MSFIRFLTGGAGYSATTAPGNQPDLAQETEAVRKIVQRLQALPVDQAKLMAGMAYVLARAANADFDISAVETAAMEAELAGAGLDQAQAALVVEMAKIQAIATGETSDYLVTREFTERSTPEQRHALLRACYHIAAADNSISAMEISVIDEITSELGITHDEEAPIRAEFADKISARLGFGSGGPRPGGS